MQLRQPPYFHATDTEMIDRWLTMGIREPCGRVPAIRPIEGEILSAWRKLSEGARREQVFDTSELARTIDDMTGKRRVATALYQKISKAAQEMAHAGVLGRRHGAVSGRSYSYDARSPEACMDGWEGSPRDTQIFRELDGSGKQGRPGNRLKNTPHDLIELTYFHLSNQGLGKPPAPAGEEPPWTLSLISQLIERCSRTSASQKIEAIHQRIHLDGEPVDVEAGRLFFGWAHEKQSELGLIAGDDAQLILAILTLAMQSITADLEAGQEPKNRVAFDLMDLARRLTPAGMNERATYQGFQRAMARIINTHFRFTFRPGGRLAQMMVPSASDTEGPRLTFSLLEKIVEGPDDDDAPVIGEGSTWEPSTRMRYFSFSLNEALWKGLCAGQGWIVHPELLYERRGVVHKVYHHLRMRTQGDIPYRVTGEMLMRQLEPQEAYTNYRRARQGFCKTLWEAINERVKRDAVMNLLSEPGGKREPVAVRWFDLDVVAMPDPSHADGIILEAQQSPDTLIMLKQQQDRLEGLRHQLQQRLVARLPAR